jgi:hypothetical protein
VPATAPGRRSAARAWKAERAWPPSWALSSARRRDSPSCAAVLVDDAQVHQQVRRQLLVLEVGAADLDAAGGAHVGGQHVEQAASPNGWRAMKASA